MLHFAITVVPFLFSLLVIYGALSDLSTFKIPNWVSYGLIGMFAIYTFLTWLNTPFLPSLESRLPPVTFYIIIAIIVFIVSVIFWKLGLIGGADVKYLTATSLWMGPNLFVIYMLMLTGLAVVLVAVLKVTRKYNFFAQGMQIPNFVKRLLDKAETNELPYGLPMGIAALILIPSIFQINH